ncbi:MAG TPA: hypothetical protein VF665_16225 [Longimicrobium sp.]|uniref:hypothetical protein n=1 Tax=Longimicrobium sp. TaxID=2029185 RepID=UPI002EDA47C2
MSKTGLDEKSTVGMLGWLADSPLYIDAQQVERFYDAVVKPEGKEGTVTIEFSSEVTQEIKQTLEIGAEIGVPSLLGNLFSFLPKLNLKGAQDKTAGETSGSSHMIELHPISNPQRQLEHLTLHYLANHRSRLCLVSDPASTEWRDPATIRRVPRELVFLDLPGEAEHETFRTCLIPTAAEFEDGKIVLLYDELVGRLKEKAGSEPISYPERAPEGRTLSDARKEYWGWFHGHFSATKAMVVVEKAASDHGRLRWIDYRVPLTGEGDTLHLHMVPAATYDTGTFAYNFIKRGYKHGIRLVGTLKSEPDMNVLAIYEK